MATDTRIRIKRDPCYGYEIWLWGNGELTRRSFNNSIDLSAKLADDRFDDETIEAACDILDVWEWGEPARTYPLGVVDVGEAVCDCCCGPVECTVTFPDDAPHRAVAFQPAEPSPFWEWAAATLRVGAVVAPWAIVLVLCRLAYAKAAGWGW